VWHLHRGITSHAEMFIPGLRPLNVRLICDAEADDANPIEPPAMGRVKFPAVISTVVREYNFHRTRPSVSI
jgi:hypothetical protein